MLSLRYRAKFCSCLSTEVPTNNFIVNVFLKYLVNISYDSKELLRLLIGKVKFKLKHVIVILHSFPAGIFIVLLLQQTPKMGLFLVKVNSVWFLLER